MLRILAIALTIFAILQIANCSKKGLPKGKKSDVIEVIIDVPDSDCEVDVSEDPVTIIKVDGDALVVIDDENNECEQDIQPCTAYFEGKDAYCSIVDVLTTKDISVYDKNYIAVVFAIYTLSKGIAQGLDYDKAFKLQKPIMKLAYKRPEDARDIILNYYIANYQQITPIRKMVNEFFSDCEDITDDDLYTCNRVVDEKICSDPQYNDINELLRILAKAAEEFNKIRPDVEKAAKKDIAIQYFSQNKECLKQLIMLHVAGTKVFNKLTCVV